MTATVHVLVVADATSARRQLGAVFADSAHFEVTAEADDVASALAQARATRLRSSSSICRSPRRSSRRRETSCG